MNNFPKYSKNKKGFTLLLAVLVSSVLLSIGLSIFNLSLKELILSSAGRDSQFAFYAADSGIECVLYWDIKHGAFSTSSPPTNISCNEQPRTVGGVDVSTFTINFPPGSACVIVSINKAELGYESVIEARGYNTCDTQNPRRVERGIRVRY